MGRDILRGLQRAMPICLGYIVIGFSVAATAYGAGFNASNVLLMSLMVAAGTSQLIATQLLADGATLMAVIATTFIVNLRHLLMSSALAPQLRTFSKPMLAVFAMNLSDEAFALHSAAAERKEFAPPAEMLAINISLHLAWVLGAVIAIFVQTDEALLHAWGLDYAPQAMFIALLALLIGDGYQWAVAGFCSVLSVTLARMGVGAESVIITTIIGATVGAWGESWISKRSSTPLQA